MELEKRMTTDLTQKPQDIAAYFNNDTEFVSVFKKTEKLASAVYLVTNLFPENEPLKWSLRNKIADLLSFIIDKKDSSRFAKPETVYKIKNKVLEITSLFEVASRGGLVSVMNFSILKEEFINLIETISTSQNTSQDNGPEVLPRQFFESNNPSFTISNNPLNKLQKEALKDKRVIGNFDLKKSNRQNLILNLIRKKKEVTIKDISEVIKDCSEKTIQRELNSFITKGVLNRTGVRRWSRYTIVE